MSIIQFKSAYYSEFMIFLFFCSSIRRLYLSFSCNNVFAFVSHLKKGLDGRSRIQRLPFLEADPMVCVCVCVSKAPCEAQSVSWPDGAHSRAVEHHSLPSQADASTDEAQG